MAECVASLLNARLVAAAAGLSLGTMVAERLGDCLNPVTPSTTAILPPAHPLPAIAELRRRFLEHHERVLESSLHTVARYRTATLHLERFGEQEKYPHAGEVVVAAFIQYLRAIEVSPNGHAHTARRRLRDKGILYVLECCRSLYHFGRRSSLLPPAFANPFSTADLGRVRIRDAKPIFVFTEAQELAFFRAANQRIWT